MTEDQRFDLVEIDAAGTAKIIEFKRYIPPKIDFLTTVNSIAAAANTAGGSILIGVDEKTGEPVGLKFAESNLDLLKRTVEKNLNLEPGTVDFKILDQAGKKYIRIDVAKQKDVVIRKTDGAVYEVRHGKEEQLPDEQAEQKIIESASNADPKDIIGALVESIDNLRTELKKAQRLQWRPIFVTAFLSPLVIALIVWALTYLGNQDIEKRRERIESRRMAANVSPYIETAIDTSPNHDMQIWVKSLQSANEWKGFLDRIGFKRALSQKIIAIKIINHGKAKAIDVRVPVIVKVWGIAPYTSDNPYRYDLEFDFRNVDVGPEYVSEAGIDVTYFPKYRLEKLPLKIIGLPELQSVKDL